MAPASGKRLVGWLKHHNLWQWEYLALSVVPLLLMLINRFFEVTNVALTNNVLSHFSLGFSVGYVGLVGYKLIPEIFQFLRKRRSKQA